MPRNADSESLPDLFREIGRTLVRYVRGQIQIVFILTLIYLVGFPLIGVPLWPLVALICGFAHAVPLVGPILGLLAPLLTLLIARAELWQYLAVLGVYTLAQALEGFYLAPKILGVYLRLRPWAVFLVVLFGGMLFGPLGVIFAAPAAAIGLLIWRFLTGREFRDHRT
ncbi:MAG: AI-2E family transporter [Bryobacteraceae bacterium]